MNGTADTEKPAYNAAIFAQNLAEAAEKSAQILTQFLSRHSQKAGQFTFDSPVFDPLGLSQAFMQMAAKLLGDPSMLMQRQMELWADYAQLWQRTAENLLGVVQEPLVEADARDKRFKDPAWRESAVFDFIRQSYLLSARWLQETVGGVEGLDKRTALKLDFYTRQFIDAMSPSNFLLTNPEVLKATIESHGENLVKGLSNLLEDMERSDGALRVSMTDVRAFELGKNLALTPGKIVFQNELMQLIQYAPATQEVYRTPILMIPAWINKFYVLDMQAENSMVKWLVEQGHTVFVISWVNPDAKLAQKRFDDYLTEGPLAALHAIEQATGEKAVSIVGYCLGGTLTSIFLAWAKAKGEAARVASVTYFTTMIDFQEAGELAVFIDEEQLSAMEARMEEKGYLEGADMAMTFNMLRANDLIWSFVVNNYLLGRDPFPFDLLYWNADSTRMPSAMHSFYLRNMYLNNALREPNALEIAGVSIDLRTVDTPSLFVSAKEDHIAPWKSTYAATQIFKGGARFLLAASGHIAGMINPPARNKYSYWTNDSLPGSPDAWLNGAQEHKGSWWPEWNRFLTRYAGDKVRARQPGEKLKPIEDAPGSYVKAA